MALLYCGQGHDNPADSRFCRYCGEPLPTGGLYPSSIVGQVLGLRYRVIRELGQGGFGRTYLAEDSHRFHELCVLKEFAPQVQGSEALQKAEELFAREAGVLYQLQHPQIPRFRELFRTDVQGKGRLFLVQDYVEGETYQALWQQRLRQGQNLSEAAAIALLRQVLPVLSYIHSVGVVHRDISPDNLICRDADALPVLIDFGGVKQIAATVASQVKQAAFPIVTSGLTRLGKAGYAPPEQMQTGEVFPHSDLYALAMTVLVLLTGKEPQELLGSAPQQVGLRDRRFWQQQVHIGPKLANLLDRMLSPYPQQRFQSAQAVLDALEAKLPAPVPNDNATRPPQEYRPSKAATVAVAPALAQVDRQSQTFTPAPPPAQRRSSGLGTLLLLLFIAAAGVGGWWEWRQLFGPGSAPQPPQPTQSDDSRPSPTPDSPQYSAAEQSRKQSLTAKREKLGIDRAFLVSLTDETFYAKHPELNGRALSDEPADENLRANWDELALEWLDRLQAVSAEARSRLGSYTPADIENRRAAVNKLNLSSRALNDLTDARFFYLFPEQPRGQDLLKLPIGQVWQAIATDQLKALQSGKTLAAIEFPNGSVAQQVNDTVKPGEGRAYTAKLSQDQVMRLILDAPAQATRLSLYPPTSKRAAMLEDSTSREWAGKLAESGIYEIVVVSAAAEPIEYALNLATTLGDSPTSPTQP
jgi:serine/threonine-protein kinase